MRVAIGLCGMRKAGALSAYLSALQGAGMTINQFREDGHGEAAVRFTWGHAQPGGSVPDDSDSIAQTLTRFAVSEARKAGAGVYRIFVEGATRRWFADSMEGEIFQVEEIP